MSSRPLLANWTAPSHAAPQTYQRARGAIIRVRVRLRVRVVRVEVRGRVRVVRVEVRGRVRFRVRVWGISGSRSGLGLGLTRSNKLAMTHSTSGVNFSPVTA